MPYETPASAHPEAPVVAEWHTDPPEWDDFVQAHPWGTVYHLTAWRRVIEAAFPHIEGRFLLLRSSENGRIVGGMPLYTVRSRLLGNRLVSVPFSSFCDPLAASSRLLAQLVEESWRFAGLHDLTSLEVRMFKSVALAKETGVSPTLYSLHHEVDLNRPTEEIWAAFSEGSVRRRIKRAANAGIVVSSNLEDSSLLDFAGMLSDNRRRHSLPDLPFRFFEAMKRHLGPERLSCWLARDRAGNPVAGLLGWRLGNRFAIEYAADFFEARVVGANQFLTWHVMRAVRSAGCASFSFGRTSLDNESLRHYKRHWGTVETDLKEVLLPNALAKTIDKDYSSYRLMQALIAHSPRALYRLIGEFCYRHLG